MKAKYQNREIKIPIKISIGNWVRAKPIINTTKGVTQRAT